jgi:hypothetical protein
VWRRGRYNSNVVMLGCRGRKLIGVLLPGSLVLGNNGRSLRMAIMVFDSFSILSHYYTNSLYISDHCSILCHVCCVDINICDVCSKQTLGSAPLGPRVRSHGSHHFDHHPNRSTLYTLLMVSMFVYSIYTSCLVNMMLDSGKLHRPIYHSPVPLDDVCRNHSC